MPDEPNNAPDNADDDSTDTEETRVVMDDTEAEAGFLEDRPPEDAPAVLRITADSEAAHRRDALDRLDRWEAGEPVPRVINFQNPSDLRALLTDRRVELLRSVMAERPDSIRGLADRLDRDVKSVYDDVGVLSEYDIVHFERDGRAKRPFVPYETIEVRLDISAPNSVDDVVRA
jgi:predicted transcriptional regulator